MRRFAPSLLLLTSMLAPAAAWAQADAPAPNDEASTPTQFINMDGLELNGQRHGPNAIRLSARQKLKFDRLAKLERNLLGDLRATAHDVALR